VCVCVCVCVYVGEFFYSLLPSGPYVCVCMCICMCPETFLLLGITYLIQRANPITLPMHDQTWHAECVDDLPGAPPHLVVETLDDLHGVACEKYVCVCVCVCVELCGQG
jgi:hypothetical protein